MSIVAKPMFLIATYGSHLDNQLKTKLFKGDIEQNFLFAKVFKCLGS